MDDVEVVKRFLEAMRGRHMITLMRLTREINELRDNLARSATQTNESPAPASEAESEA